MTDLLLLAVTDAPFESTEPVDRDPDHAGDAATQVTACDMRGGGTTIVVHLEAAGGGSP